MGRQAVQEAGIHRSRLHQAGVDLIVGKGGAAFFAFVLLAHADPYVGIDAAGVRDGLAGIGRHGQLEVETLFF